MNRDASRRRLTLFVALIILDASLTFQNVWPTPAITWRGALSIELALFGLALIAWHARGTGPSRSTRRWLTVAWLFLILGRYATVTAPALWGRELNFYWDLRFLPDVFSMLARAARPWLVVAAIAAIVPAAGGAYLITRWCIGRLSAAASDVRERTVLGSICVLLATLFLIDRIVPDTLPLRFPPPVTATYSRQAGFVVAAVGRAQHLPPSPSFASNLERVTGADVLVFFIESYGAVAFERPSFNARLDPGRQALASAIHDSGYQVASTLATSPTFGGSSWFAHISLLSGLHIGDPDANALLMTEQRDTLPKMFGRSGYRTVAMMPGIWTPWPEGGFYGFSEIYTGERLQYHGPPFGWFTMTDQFVLARLDQWEMDRSPRPPLFVFFPTVSTHTPFAPTPPFQPDWRRLLTDLPYDDRELEHAYDQQPEWTNLGPSYVDSLAYMQQWLAGYVRRHAGRDAVLIVLGDHQPPALVTGEGAPWAVPVHVISSRPAILDRLKTHGFVDGLTPERTATLTIEGLVPALLDAFGAPQ